MDEQQLVSMLATENYYFSSSASKTIKSHPKRRLIADGLHKLTDDEKVSDDVFAVTMSIFDRFVARTLSTCDDRACQLIALSCYNLAKKLRTNVSITNENELTSLIFLNENYTDEEIFNAEQQIVEALDWELSTVVPHDYMHLLFRHIRLPEASLAKLHLHVRHLLSLTICELNTLTTLPSLLCCACIRDATKGLHVSHLSSVDELILQKIRCAKHDLLHTHRLIEQLFQSCLQDIQPAPVRRCLAPINTGNKAHASPRVK